MPYLIFIQMGIGLLQQIVSGLKGAKAPKEVIDSVQAGLDSLLVHQTDMITKANLDSLRN